MVELLRFIVPIGAVLAVGSTLLLGSFRPFRRLSLADRLAPFSHSPAARGASTATLRDVALPLVIGAGEHLSRWLGVRSTLAQRLQRSGSAQTVEEFRLQQFAAAGGALLAGLGLATALQPPIGLVVLFVVGLPLLTVLVLEQRATIAAQKRQEQLFIELPIFSEQLAMLLSAGYSLNAALNRLAQRGNGQINTALKTVCERVRHGLTTTQALNEWAGMMDVAELHRLVTVLALGSESTDLGRLVSDEARSIRREAQRRLAATIDKRAQQVWIPVTVATLVPGVIFLAIPFFQALSLFSGS